MTDKLDNLVRLDFSAASGRVKSIIDHESEVLRGSDKVPFCKVYEVGEETGVKVIGFPCSVGHPGGDIVGPGCIALPEYDMERLVNVLNVFAQRWLQMHVDQGTLPEVGEDLLDRAEELAEMALEGVGEDGQKE